jgi:hypothetical protein
MKARLNIGGVDVPFMEELAIAETLEVSDVRDIGQTKGAYSKTIEIPGTPAVNALFENIFQVNVKTNNFNPNLKTPAEYFVNEVSVFKGGLQLRKIRSSVQQQINKNIYECVIIGNNANLFLDIAGKMLTDIDFSDLNHTLTITKPVLSDTKFNPAVIGSGYVYPYIDYGLNPLGVPLTNIWKFEHLKPAIFAKEYLLRIFSNAGYSWSNTSHFNFSDFQRKVVPDVNEGALKYSSAVALANSFRAGLTANANQNTAGTYAAATVFYAPANRANIIFDDDTTSPPYFDGNSMYDSITGLMSPQILAYYDVTTVMTLEIDINQPSGANFCNGTIQGDLIIQKTVNNGVSWQTVASSKYTLNVANTGTAKIVNAIGVSTTIQSDKATPSAGQFYRTGLINQVGFLNFLDSGSSPITSGATSIDINIKGAAGINSSTFYAQIKKTDLPYGASVTMNNTIPTGVTQLDFLTSIIKKENLKVEINKSDSKVYEITPGNDFVLTTDPLDWTYKLDMSKDIEILPMAELDAKRYVFKDKPDGDHYNKSYFDEFGEVYGQHTQEVDNDFVKDDKVVETIFSPTPIASWNSASIICPRFFKMEALPNGAPSVKPTKVNIRLLNFQQVTAPWTYSSLEFGTDSQLILSYPYAGDLDNPFFPATDINFGTPKKVFWDFAGAQYPTRNRYNERYSKHISEITDRDSKLVIAYFNLTELDISTFSFRKIVFVIDSYYIVNRIIDYTPSKRQSVKVELLKLKGGPTFVPSTITIGSGGIAVVPTGPTTANKTNGGGFTVGNNNSNGGYASFVNGEGNVVGDGANNVTLMNSNNVVVSGQVEGFFGFGLQNEEIDSSESNTARMGVLLSAPIKDRYVIYNADFNTSIYYDTYEVDTDSGNVIATLEPTGQKLTFIKTFAANVVTLTPSSGLINGAATKDLTSQYETVTITFNGTDWYIV